MADAARQHRCMALHGLSHRTSSRMQTSHAGVPDDDAVAVQSLLRPALMGGAQVLWTLQPESQDERVRRQLLVIHEEFKESRHLAREALELPLRDALPASARQAAERQLAGATERQSKASAELRRRGFAVQPVNMTDVIKDAAALVAADDVWRQQGIRSAWRLASGDAHGKIWPTIHRGSPLPSTTPGMVLLEDGPNISMVGMTAGCAYALTKAALDLFQQRCAARAAGPDASPPSQ
ncbi:hypothetical protein [Blastococcus aggregatus]|uniref:hypothetical protein n=1 Tax=Blastococcus aggregatus TaxID=38502 RepID=UPI001141F649|nr:hypothetical protein [Blastococcus aggregatus]